MYNIDFEIYKEFVYEQHKVGNIYDFVLFDIALTNKNTKLIRFIFSNIIGFQNISFIFTGDIRNCWVAKKNFRCELITVVQSLLNHEETFWFRPINRQYIIS